MKFKALVNDVKALLSKYGHKPCKCDSEAREESDESANHVRANEKVLSAIKKACEQSIDKETPCT